MNKFTLAALVAVTAASANVAHGHGFLISNDNGKLVLTSEDPAAGGLPIYTVQALLGTATYKSTDHPGFDVQSGIGGGASITFDVLGPLWYTVGSGSPIPSPVDMNISPQDISVPGSVTVTGGSGFQPGFLIGEFDGTNLGTYEHQLYYEWDVPSGVPIGTYAVAMELTGIDSSGHPFTPSDPFVAVFNNGLPVGNLPIIAGQLYAAAITVPEPSSVILALLAGIGLAVHGLRSLRLRKS